MTELSINPLYVLFALQVLDMISTVIALRSPNLVEQNVLLKPLFDHFGALPVLLVAKGGVMAYVWYVQAGIDPRLLWAMSAGYAWIVATNFKLIRQNL
jgi:uncharacterized membrane protein